MMTVQDQRTRAGSLELEAFSSGFDEDILLVSLVALFLDLGSDQIA